MFGFYHDGCFSTLLDVVHRYDNCFSLGLSDQDKTDLVLAKSGSSLCRPKRRTRELPGLRMSRQNFATGGKGL